MSNRNSVVRSRTERRAQWRFAALALSAALAWSAPSPQTALPVATGQTPSSGQVNEALAQVKADPNLSPVRKISTLKWVNGPDKTPRDRRVPRWLAWILGLFAWLSESSRVLVWLVVAALVGILIIYIARLMRGRDLSARAERFAPPSHVRDLDIRPESLPDDIGKAARALWDGGEQRAALALLYRGLLSRLVHVHDVPIRDSSTEGDCLALSVPHLNEMRMSYASRLVRIWQRAVYGGEQVDPSAVYALCDEFSAAMDAAPQGAPIGAAAEQST
jgi:hypothetical protein